MEKKTERVHSASFFSEMEGILRFKRRRNRLSARLLHASLLCTNAARNRGSDAPARATGVARLAARLRSALLGAHRSSEERSAAASFVAAPLLASRHHLTIRSRIDRSLVRPALSLSSTLALVPRLSICC